MQVMRGPVAPSGLILLTIAIVACTPAVESQSSSATNPSAWSSNESESEKKAAPQTTPDKPTAWEHIEALKSFRKTGARFRSQHLQGAHDAEVLVNESAGAYPALGPSRQPPAGAMFVEALYVPNQTEVAMYFVMLKRASSTGSEWEYAVVSSAGMIEHRGALALCARCHAEAPYDHLFGRPH